MTHRCVAVSALLAMAVSLLLAPAVVIAGGPVVRPMVGRGALRALGVHQGAGVQPGSTGSFELVAAPAQPGAPRNVVSRPFVPNVVTPGMTVASWVYASPVVYAAPPTYDPPPPAYGPPTEYYPPPVSYPAPVGNVIVFAPSPEPAPMPTVVEFSTGRYELRGDGMATAYFWVWIPNPPSAPPPAPPSQAPDPDDRPVSARRQLYRWTDEAGVAYWTDRLDAVPQQLRAEAEQPRLR